jgi:hypothetical protein
MGKHLQEPMPLRLNSLDQRQSNLRPPVTDRDEVISELSEDEPLRETPIFNKQRRRTTYI